jgi:hypothetical protein
MADSQEVSFLVGRNAYTYSEVLLARFMYEKSRTLARGDFEGIAETQFTS